MDRLDRALAELLHILQLLGVLLAVVLVMGILIGVVRSLAQVALGRATLVMPFAGGSEVAWVSDVLAQQLDSVESAVLVKHQAIRSHAGTQGDTAPVSLGPAARFLPEKSLDEQQEQFVVDHPINGQAVGPVTLLGVTFSPDFLFAVFYRLRALAARKTVRGSLYSVGSTDRLAAHFTFPKKAAREGLPGAPAAVGTVLVQRESAAGNRLLLKMVDDLAFGIVRERMHLDTGTSHWQAYASFLDGYVNNQRFLRTGDIASRERALTLYLAAVATDGMYHLAAYNAACMLYNKYREGENAKAIDLFRSCANSDDEDLKALALAGLTMAYAQNVHRFGLGRVPWVEEANLSSQQAVNLRPDFEETRFARAWAYQLSGEIDEAIAEYTSVGELDGDSLGERQIKSFAGNNKAFLLITEKGDLANARSLLEEVARLYPNKMVYANLADTLRRQGDLDGALKFYARARDLDPLYAAGHNETAIVYLNKAAAEGDDVTRAKLVEIAEEWHSRAMGVIPESDTNQRRKMQDTYQAAFREAQKATGSTPNADGVDTAR